MVFQLADHARDAGMAAVAITRDSRERTRFDGSRECSEGVEQVHEANPLYCQSLLSIGIRVVPWMC
jgi:hypothetical protein